MNRLEASVCRRRESKETRKPEGKHSGALTKTILHNMGMAGSMDQAAAEEHLKAMHMEQSSLEG